MSITYENCDIPVGICLLKVNNRNPRTRCEICSKLTIATPERRHWRRSSVSIVNFEHVIAGWDFQLVYTIPNKWKSNSQQMNSNTDILLKITIRTSRIITADQLHSRELLLFYYKYRTSTYVTNLLW